MGKILIVGQGLAGTSLAELLRERGENIVIVDNNNPSAASRVAGGAFNPVVFKRMTRTFNAARIIPFMRTWVGNLEKRYGEQLLFDYPLYKLFSGPDDIEFWKKRVESEGLGTYCDTEVHSIQEVEEINPTHGAGLVRGAGRVDVPKMLHLIRTTYAEEGVLRETSFHYEDLIPGEQITWKGEVFDHVIFAEGRHGVNNPWFGYIKYRNTKGELLEISLNSEVNVMLNKRATIMPLGDGKYKFGATYNWRNLDAGTTDEAREELEKRLQHIVGNGYEVIGQRWGVRPTSHDRRPIVGAHPEHSGLWIFNGLGSKGMMLGPYYAQQLVNLILDNQPVDEEVSVKRYTSVEK